MSALEWMSGNECYIKRNHLHMKGVKRLTSFISRKVEKKKVFWSLALTVVITILELQTQLVAASGC